MINPMRYFEITSLHLNGDPEVICEYFGDFGEWACVNLPYRYSIKQGKEIWVVASGFKITSKVAEETCKILTRETTIKYIVDMVEASNPLHSRQPAMKKKGRK